jgi:hypothetical protein
MEPTAHRGTRITAHHLRDQPLARSGTTVLAVEGELDLATALRLKRPLMEAAVIGTTA